VLEKSLNSKIRWQTALRSSLAVLSLSLLASCGGGKREAFQPGHMYMFGDEYSYIDINQADSNDNTYERYSVNWVASLSPTKYSSIYPAIWAQYVSSHYIKGASPCANTASDQMSLCSAPGQTVADTINTINTKSFQKDELVLIMAGTHDILNQYRNFKADPGNIGTYANNARQAGISLAQKINAIITTGARVAVATIPDIGLSPYAAGEGTLRDHTQAMECSSSYQPSIGQYSKALSYLTACFNQGLRGSDGITNDGRKIALISTFDWSVLIARSPSSYGVTYPFAAQCASVTHTTAATYDPTTCNYDAVTDPDNPTTTANVNSTHLWSFGPWLGVAGHQLLGARAISQIDNNWGE